MKQEKLCKSKKQDVLSQLEQAEKSNMLLQETKDLLEEQINEITVAQEMR
jgi:hypothetical protein